METPEKRERLRQVLNKLEKESYKKERKDLSQQQDPHKSLERDYTIRGYVEAVQQMFRSNQTEMKVMLYAYESEEKAVGTFDELVSTLRQDGGFEEVDVSSVPAKCYSTDRLFGQLWYRIDNYCTASNAIFHIQSFPAVEEDTIMFSKAVASKFTE